MLHQVLGDLLSHQKLGQSFHQLKKEQKVRGKQRKVKQEVQLTVLLGNRKYREAQLVQKGPQLQEHPDHQPSELVQRKLKYKTNAIVQEYLDHRLEKLLKRIIPLTNVINHLKYLINRNHLRVVLPLLQIKCQ